jgi:DNA repair exonuclease SbcCD nuclease subunit
VFETNAVDRQVVLRALDALGDVPVPVYLLPGNHDPLDAGSLYTSPTFRRACPSHVAVLDGAAAAPGDVELVGAPWRTKRPLVDLLAAACTDLGPAPAGGRVVVGHGAVDLLSPDVDDPATIRLAPLEALVERGLVSYVALGDRHSHTAVGQTGAIRYSGAPEPTDFDEVDPGKVLEVVLDDERRLADVVAHPVATWRFTAERFPLDGPADIDALERWFAERPSRDRTVVRLRLSGTLRLHDHARLEQVLAEARDRFAAVDVPGAAGELSVVVEDADLAALDLTGFAADAVQELRVQARSGGLEATVARDALALLHRLGGAA